MTLIPELPDPDAAALPVRPTPELRPWRIPVLALALSALLFGIPGCGEEEAPEPVEAPPQKTAEEIAKEQDRIALERTRQRFERAQRVIQENPGMFEEHLLNLEGLALEAEGTVLAEPIARAIEEQKQARETYARDRLAQIVPEVDRLVEQREYRDAEDLIIAQFDPAGLLGETAAQKDFEAKLDWIRRSADAQTEYERVTRRALSFKRSGDIHDLAKAVGVLVSFPDEYQDTEYFPEIEELTTECMELFLAAKKELAKFEDVPWVDFPIDEYLSRFRSSGGDDVWKVEGDVVRGESSGAQALFEIGEQTWTSYAVEFEIRVPAGQEIHIGVTCIPPRPGSASRQYAMFPYDLETSDWTKLLVEFRDGLVDIRNLETLEPVTLDPYAPRGSNEGGIGIGLAPGDRVELRNIRAKIYTKREEPAPDEGASSGGDDG